MEMDIQLLTRFERELIPHDLSRSSVPAKIIGFGEISAIFQIGEDPDIIYKRLPLFPDIQTAEAYRKMYFEYCALLRQAGINLPWDDAVIIELPDRPVVIYFAQQRFDASLFCHHLIHTLDEREREAMLIQILTALTGIWGFNQDHTPRLEIAVDSQLSNWVWRNENGAQKLYLVDTSTPFIRKNGVEQLDVGLLLQSAPSYIRWLIRLLNLDDVIDRYYDHKNVLTDLIANLYKEQRPELIPQFLILVNPYLKDPLTRKEIDRYYKEDKMIWTLFSALRKLDRFICVRLLKKRYEFILPGRVKR
jgi:hypothetical protein